ncbi:hypothetical protein AB1Y20_012504 [Prymnesium parvum]|uniref:D-glutamate cyclase-like C-terminal domain-containing protein n=1 Tax=Prymnesium parvum TaxID=97485 RepID=A0AB34II23_PRYPA
MRRSLAVCAPSAPSVEVIGFPSAERWTAEDDARLARLGGASSSLVCIERAGEASDGVCRTMRGLPMGAALLGHLSRLLDAAAVESVAIGDGGNELGMGALYEEICAAIPNGPLIGCSRAADVAVVASVSNWGGHALSCALALLAWDQGASSPIIDGLQGSADNARAFLGATVHTVEISRQVLHAVCEAGAVDGITRAANGDVDGLPLALQLEILDELLEIARVAMEESPRGAASP